MREKDGFCELIKETEGKLYALAFSMLGNEDDAADAVSEAILKGYAGIKSLRNRDAFKIWMMKILHNVCVGMLKKRKNDADVDEQYDLADKECERDRDEAMTVRKAVESLKQPYRTAAVLFYWEDMSVEDIAKLTGCSRSAVKKQLSRARSMLRERLEGEVAENEQI